MILHLVHQDGDRRSFDLLNYNDVVTVSRMMNTGNWTRYALMPNRTYTFFIS
jgi:hypothetical protein